jgi:hypothetical protein
MMGSILYASLRAHGVGFFRDYVLRVFALGAALADADRRRRRLRAGAPRPPPTSCASATARPVGPPPGPALDELQATMRTRGRDAAAYYFLDTQLAGARWLRTALMNPLTTRRRARRRASRDPRHSAPGEPPPSARPADGGGRPTRLRPALVGSRGRALERSLR